MSNSKSGKSKKMVVSNKLPIEYGNDKVHVKSIDNQDSTEFGDNYMYLTISGTNVNSIFSQTIVRTIISLVGSYAFSQDNITFESNTSLFNRDYIKLRISTTPIVYKDYKYDPIDNFAERCVNLEKIKNEIGYREITELEKIEIQNKKSELLVDNIHMHVSTTNTTSDILYVTTNSEFTTFYKNGIVIPDIYPRESLIIALKPGQEINFTAIADFNIPMVNNCYSSAYHVSHRMIDNNTFCIKLRSYRQMREKRIVIEACEIIKLKFDALRTNIFTHMQTEEFLSENKNSDYEGTVIVNNENHTMSEIFTRRLQDHENSKYVGFIVEHPDENIFKFKYVVNGTSIKRILNDVIESLIDDYSIIAKSIV